MSKRVLITGITGFLGSHIAEKILSQGDDRVIGLKRHSSDLWRCRAFSDKICWVAADDAHWKQDLIALHPDVIIHTAWSGVGAGERDDWRKQFDNIGLVIDLLDIAQKAGAKKFIGFGSQAEYGHFSGIIAESSPAKPNSAYGVAKVAAMETIRCFCDKNDIEWIWLRLFSFFGEKEGSGWLIPAIVDALRHNSRMEMTPGEQRYAYMYAGDAARIVADVARQSVKAAVYNLSSHTSRSIREMVENIREIIRPDKSDIRLGAIPYREGQTMHVQGDVKRLEAELGKITESDFKTNLEKTVKYILATST